MNPTQINQGGAQIQEKQPPEQTGSLDRQTTAPEASKSHGELTEGRPHPTKPKERK